MNILQDFKTLRGVPAGVMFNALSQLLPKTAYKAAGVSYLTDINTGFMTRMLESIFGPAGLGWKFEYNTDDLQVTVGEKNRINAVLKKGTFTYFLVGPDGIKYDYSVTSAGSSDNNEDGYAIAGAITATLGQCISRMGWQNPVYCGMASHTNIEQILRDYGINFGALTILEDMSVDKVVKSYILAGKANKAEKTEKAEAVASSAGASPAASTPAAAATTAPASATAAPKPATVKPGAAPKAAPAADKPAAVAPAQVAEKAVAATPVAEGVAEGPAASENPAEFVITIGNNNKGKKLGELTDSQLTWYAEKLQATPSTAALKAKAAELLATRQAAAK